jgi:hypothetical protein
VVVGLSRPFGIIDYVVNISGVSSWDYEGWEVCIKVVQWIHFVLLFKTNHVVLQCRNHMTGLVLARGALHGQRMGVGIGMGMSRHALGIHDDMLAVSIIMKTIKISTLLEVLLREASG